MKGEVKMNSSIKKFLFPFTTFFGLGKIKAIAIILIYLSISLSPCILLILNKKIFESVSLNTFSLQNVSMFLFLYFVILIINRVLIHSQNLLTIKVKQDIYVDLQCKINRKMMKMSIVELDNPSTQDLLNRISDVIPHKCVETIFAILDVSSLIIQILIATTLLLEIEVILPIVLVTFTVPYIFLYKKMCFDNYFKEVNQGKNHRRNWYLIKMLFEKHYNKELKIYNCFNYLCEKERRINEQLHNENYRIAKKYSIYTVLLDFIKGIGKALSLIVVMLLILNYNANISAFTVLMQSMDTIQNGIMNVFSKIGSMNSLLLVYNDFVKFLALHEEGKSEKKVDDDRANGFIEIQELTYGYPTKPNVINGVNLKINEGERIAIVGRNGSGKTTLINLLLGFYKPLSGSISVNGNHLDDVLYDFRKNTVYVMQNLQKYSFSIKDNIQMKNKSINTEVASILGLDELIEKSPKGLETLLGEENEDSYNISGGEWVKLGIVRNCQKEHPLLYILDEPTATLDPIVESRIINSFDELTKEKTTIFITHRLGMVSLADKIIVLEDGRIIEEGTHESLMSNKATYYEMYTKQLKLYERG